MHAHIPVVSISPIFFCECKLSLGVWEVPPPRWFPPYRWHCRSNKGWVWWRAALMAKCWAYIQRLKYSCVMGSLN